MIRENVLKNKKLILHSIILGIFLSFFYNYLVVENFEPFNLKFSNVKDTVKFDLPGNYTYLLKVWGIEYPQKVYFNKRCLKSFYLRERGQLREAYFLIGEDLLDKGGGKVELISDSSYSLRIMNFLAKEKYGALLFNTSGFLNNNNFGFARLFLFSLIFGFLIFWFFKLPSFLVKELFNLSFEGLSFVYVLSYFLCFIILIFVLILFYIFSSRLIINMQVFFGISVLSLALVQIANVLIKFLGWGNVSRQQNFVQRNNMAVSKPKHHSVIKWFINRTFSDKCILAFVFVIALVSFLSIIGFRFAADNIGYFAYFILIAVMVSCFSAYLRDQRRK
jgi:hypothetical protein